MKIDKQNAPDWSNVIIDGKRSRQKGMKNIRITWGHKNKRNNDGRIINSKEYAIAWGVLNKPYSQELLRKMCRNYDAPSFNFILRIFGNYVSYYKELLKYGMPPRPPRTDEEKRKIINHLSGRVIKRVLLTQDYNLAEYCAKNNIKTREEYKEFCKRSEIKIPCYNTVRKRFGSFTAFMNEVRKYSLDMTITDYVKESLKVGHWLRLSECDKLKIVIRPAMDILRPRFFNALCYRKMEILLEEDKSLKRLVTWKSKEDKEDEK